MKHDLYEEPTSADEEIELDIEELEELFTSAIILPFSA